MMTKLSPGQERAIVQQARSLFYQKALVVLDGQVVGATAAIRKTSPGKEPESG